MSELLGLTNFSKWNMREISHVEKRLIMFFSRHMSVLGTGGWSALTADILEKPMHSVNAPPLRLSAEGFDLFFFGPHLKKMDLEGKEGFIESEPQFILKENNGLELIPRTRNHFYRTLNEIGEEMRESYKLTIKKNPFSFRFPRQFYSESHSENRELYLIPLLGVNVSN
jgi:hypothetical protein